MRLLTIATLAGNRLVAVVAQKNAENVLARPEDLYRVGTLALLHELGREASSIRLAVQGIARIRLLDFVRTEPYLVAQVEQALEPREEGVELDALVRTAAELFSRLVHIAAELSDDLAVRSPDGWLGRGGPRHAVVAW